MNGKWRWIILLFLIACSNSESKLIEPQSNYDEYTMILNLLPESISMQNGSIRSCLPYVAIPIFNDSILVENDTIYISFEMSKKPTLQDLQYIIHLPGTDKIIVISEN